MADAGDNSRALLAAASGQWWRQKWEVDFARYLATPRRAPSTPPPPGLRYVSRGKLRCHGTWLPAASPARLCISRPSQPFAAPVLTVSIGDVVYEEHYVSILNFSWPQVACVTQCPIRGSRVVFMSFCDRSKQIQKFAVRFPQLSDAESFLNHVKECSSNTMDIIPSGSNCVLDDSSSEYIASNGVLCRPAEAASFEEPTSDHKTDAPALAYHEKPDQPGANIDSNYSSFPHSCSEMLTNCSIDSEKDGEPCEVTATDHAPEKAYMLDTCHDVLIAGKDIDVGKETGDIMARMKTYVATDSFHDMLSKLDKVIDELGGDMSL